MLSEERNYDYSDTERHSSLRHTPMMLTPTLHEPRKLTSTHITSLLHLKSAARLAVYCGPVTCCHVSVCLSVPKSHSWCLSFGTLVTLHTSFTLQWSAQWIVSNQLHSPYGIRSAAFPGTQLATDCRLNRAHGLTAQRR